MPRKTRHLINTSKLQFSPNFTLNSVADSNYRGKCDVGGFLIFEWSLVVLFVKNNNVNSKVVLYYKFWKKLFVGRSGLW
jgi:hypothetical protein